MTDYRHPQIAALRLNGASSGQIARAVGLTRNAVVGRLVRMGLMGDASQYVRKPRPVVTLKRMTRDWDRVTFEPYAARKARLAMEKNA